MKIFLCSTAHDLLDFRALAVERIRAAGHTALYHAIPTFAALRGMHSHDMCAFSVDEADAVVCIIDRRYGGAYSGNLPRLFPDQSVEIRGFTRSGRSRNHNVVVPTKNLSISWCELIRGYALGKQIVTFARARTLDEKQTRRRNQFSRSFAPAYAECNELFDLLDWITKKPVDNWIIAFHSIVDFDEKLRIWLDKLGGASTSPGTPPWPSGFPNTPLVSPGGEAPPVTIVVEGATDRAVVLELVRALKLPVRVDIVIAGGKLGILQNAQKYLTAFAASGALVFLVDADTDSDAVIAHNREQFTRQAGKVQGPPVYLEFAVPRIEAWLMAAVDPQRYMQLRGTISSAEWESDIHLPSVLDELSRQVERVIALEPSCRKFCSTLHQAAQAALIRGKAK